MGARYAFGGTVVGRRIIVHLIIVNFGGIIAVMYVSLDMERGISIIIPLIFIITYIILLAGSRRHYSLELTHHG